MGTANLNLEDGTIVIRDAGRRYVDTLANFEADAQQGLPGLPAEILALRYDQADARLIVSSGNNQTERKASLLKAKLDWAIGALDSLLDRQAARAPVPSAPPPSSIAAQLAALEARIAALEAAETKRSQAREVQA